MDDGQKRFVVSVRGETSKVRRGRTAVAHSDHIIGVLDEFKKISGRNASNDLIFYSERKGYLADLLEQERQHHRFELTTSHVIRTERSDRTSPQAIVNMFAAWFDDVGLTGCSSHSGRRTFITSVARKISSVGGSLRDVQMLADHSSLAVTQRYIEGEVEARTKVVELV